MSDRTDEDQSDPRNRTEPLDELTFPRVARLELDELLEQLVARARDVQDTQGRLRGLLRANLTIARAVDLESVLRHTVSAARELVSARYAALGIVRDGSVVRFLHEGMDVDTVTRIGQLPEGKGLLGRLVDYPQPLRLSNIGSHESSVGFPEHHPPMRSFLGVPIQVGDRVFGNLYLTDKNTAEEFSADDQELVQALAAAAALAIDNAQLFDQIRRGQTWQNALVEITTGLLSGTDDPDQALHDLVRHALLTARGTGAGIYIQADPGTLVMTVADGTYDRWLGLHLPIDGSIAGAALSAGSAVLADNPATDPRLSESMASEPLGPVIAVPVNGAAGQSGVLCVSRAPGDEPFDAADQELIAAFASRAELALGLAANRRHIEEMNLVDDRVHIAEQLREQVISRLFTAGLTVQSILPRVPNPIAQQALSRHIDEIDAIIAEVRNAVFAIRSAPNDLAPKASSTPKD